MMNATLLDLPIETPETSVSCANCPAVQRLERALEELRTEFRWEVGYWKSRHADAVKRIDRLKEELDQSRGQTRALQDKLFGRKSEKSARSDRSNDLFDPEEVAAAAKRRGVQPGHVGHRRRDYSHLPVHEEFVPLPEESLACPRCGNVCASGSARRSSKSKMPYCIGRWRVVQRRAGGRPKTLSRSCPGISLLIAVRRWPCEPRMPSLPIPRDVADPRLVSQPPLPPLPPPSAGLGPLLDAFRR